MLEWLTKNVSVFKLQHDAHREFRLSVAEHLAHRARIGNAPIFLESRDEEMCIRRNILWELRVILSDDTMFDIAGSSLEKCVSAVQELKAQRPVFMAA